MGQIRKISWVSVHSIRLATKRLEYLEAVTDLNTTPLDGDIDV